MSRRAYLLSCAFLIGCWSAGVARAVEYMSVSAPHAILYDAPSLQAKKLFVVNRYMPFETVVSLDAWVKVRDRSGGLYWVEKSALTFKRYVFAVLPIVEVRKAPDAAAPSVFHARQQVSLELLEDTSTGWLKVRHLDGDIGYVKHNEVWGN